MLQHTAELLLNALIKRFILFKIVFIATGCRRYAILPSHWIETSGKLFLTEFVKDILSRFSCNSQQIFKKIIQMIYKHTVLRVSGCMKAIRPVTTSMTLLQGQETVGYEKIDFIEIVISCTFLVRVFPTYKQAAKTLSIHSVKLVLIVINEGYLVQ